MKKFSVCLQIAAALCLELLPATSFGVVIREPAGSVVVQSTTGTPGTYLTDARGRSLYMFEADTSTMSQCYDQCAQAWPPLLVSEGQNILVAGNTRSNLVGTVTRADGSQQLTYNGMPLYYFVKDKNQGEVTGQGLFDFGATWYLVSPAGTKLR